MAVLLLAEQTCTSEGEQDLSSQVTLTSQDTWGGLAPPGVPAPQLSDEVCVFVACVKAMVSVVLGGSRRVRFNCHHLPHYLVTPGYHRHQLREMSTDGDSKLEEKHSSSSQSFYLIVPSYNTVAHFKP